MKNSKVIIVFAAIIMGLIMTIFYFLMSSKDYNKSYVIKEWSNFAESINIEIEDETIIKSTESHESSRPEIDAGGSTTLFTITGLKKGRTTATVNVVNHDGSIKSSKKYYFEVSRNLKVKLIETNVIK